jgi:hypothetical protein
VKADLGINYLDGLVQSIVPGNEIRWAQMSIIQKIADQLPSTTHGIERINEHVDHIVGRRKAFWPCLVWLIEQIERALTDLAVIDGITLIEPLAKLGDDLRASEHPEWMPSFIYMFRRERTVSAEKLSICPQCTRSLFLVATGSIWDRFGPSWIHFQSLILKIRDMSLDCKLSIIDVNMLKPSWT